MDPSISYSLTTDREGGEREREIARESVRERTRGGETESQGQRKEKTLAKKIFEAGFHKPLCIFLICREGLRVIRSMCMKACNRRERKREGERKRDRERDRWRGN